MRRSALSLSVLSTVIFCILLFSTSSFAAAPDRITAPIVGANSIRLAAGVPMQAKPEFDQGAVDPTLQLSYITLLTVPSAAQKKALNKLYLDQQNPRSASYHKWLTPEQYADRFGLSPTDVLKITAWLQSQGFTVVRTARGRNWIAFSGTAAQVARTFQTQIHSFKVDGEMHFANTTPPAIPMAFSGIVAGFRGFNDFRLKSQARRAKPGYTFPSGGTNFLFVSPGDVAAIYDVNTLYTNGIDGTGQSVAVIGETGVYQSDLTNFRQNFGLSAISCTTSGDIITSCNTANFKYILVNGSATSIFGDLPEADIDIEWSGAAARNAKIIYVTANATNVFDSMYYTIDNDVSPVMTMSYTTPCELAEIGFFDADEAELQKANTEGITFMNSSGDTGAAECDFGDPSGVNLAIFGYAVGYPTSSQYITSVGGTLIPSVAPNEYSSTYWNPTNGSDGGSAKGYIPEQAWNDAEEFGLECAANPTSSFCQFYGITNWATAQSALGLSAGGGGVSNCVTADSNFVCLSGFPQPSWQAGLSASAVNPGGIGEISAGTPTRYTPDISLLASANLPGYLVCTQSAALGGSGSGSTCDSPTTGITDMLTACFAGTEPCSIFGGTSVSSPIFAGIVALLNQQVVASGVQTVPGLGNINPTLYSLAAANSTNHAFNPVTTSSAGASSNGAFCEVGTPTSGVGGDPWPASLQCPSSGFLGFNAFNADPTTGYNLVTGLGSINASHLAAAWVAQGSSTSTTLISSQNPQAFGSAVTFTATVTTTGTNTPTGTVTFNDGTTALGTGTLGAGPGVVGSQQATFSTSTLSSGSHSITAVYAGDANNAGSTSAILTQTITAPDFALANTTGSNPTVLAGQTTGPVYSFTVTPSGAATFAATVTFSCSSFSPTDPTLTSSSCSFSPASIAAGGGAQTVTMNLVTAGPNPDSGVRTRQIRRRADNRLPWLPLTLPLAGVVMVGFAGRKLSKYSVVASLCLALVLAGFLIACGSSSHPIAVGVTGPASVFPNDAADGWPNQTAQFTASVTNDSGNKGVTWTASSGSIDATGLFTAPTVGASSPVTITATSVADSSKTGTSSIALKPTTVPGPYTITLTVTEEQTNKNLTPAPIVTVQ
jgi:subtilase family serine protease